MRSKKRAGPVVVGKALACEASRSGGWTRVVEYDMMSDGTMLEVARRQFSTYMEKAELAAKLGIPQEALCVELGGDSSVVGKWVGPVPDDGVRGPMERVVCEGVGSVDPSHN